MQIAEKIPLHHELGARAGHAFMLFFGVGNHGGAPTKAEIREIDARIAAGEPLKYSDPNVYFAEAATGPLPRVEDELQFHAVGCYAVASDLKRLNRRAESILEQAETAATLASLTAGAAYPRAAFEGLWRTLLFNQFHDTLGGTSLHTACEDSVFELSSVIAGAEIALNAAVRRLAAGIAPPVDPTDGTFVVLNLNGAPYDGMIEAEPWVDKDVVSPRTLRDDTGRPVPLQYIDPLGKTPGLQRFAFRALVPAFGYKVFRFAIDPAGAPSPGMVFGRRTEAPVLETEGYRLTIDRQTGAIAELLDKATGKPVFSGPAHRAFIAEDGTDTWGHGTHSFPFDGQDMALEEMLLIDDGPLRKSLRVTSRCGETRLSTIVVVPGDANLPVELRVDVDWREKGRLLRFAYPLAAGSFEYEVPSGWQARPDVGHEVPGLRWVRAVGPDRTVVLANDAKYSYAAKDGVLYLTALRSPVFSHHDPVKLRDEAFLRYMDQGPSSFVLRLRSAPAISRREAHLMADALTKPPVVTTHVARHGTRPHAGAWLEVDPTANVVVTTLKTAEDGDAPILRALELDGTPGRLGHGQSAARLDPRRIATLRVGDDGLRPTNGLEEDWIPQDTR